MSGSQFGGGGYGGMQMRQQQQPWQRNYAPSFPGSTGGNPTARPDFHGQGPFNNMAYQTTPFGGGNPYGSFFPAQNFGGRFSPFGSTTGGAFNRGGNSSLYQPSYGGGYGGYGGGKYGGGQPQMQGQPFTGGQMNPFMRWG